MYINYINFIYPPFPPLGKVVPKQPLRNNNNIKKLLVLLL